MGNAFVLLVRSGEESPVITLPCSLDDARMLLARKRSVNRYVPDAVDIFIEMMTRNGVHFEKVTLEKKDDLYAHAAMNLKKEGFPFMLHTNIPTGIAIAVQLGQSVFMDGSLWEFIWELGGDAELSRAANEAVDDEDDLPKN